MNWIQIRTNRKQGLEDLATGRQIFSPENNVNYEVIKSVVKIVISIRIKISFGLVLSARDLL